MMIKAMIKYFNEVAKEDTKPKEYEPGHKGYTHMVTEKQKEIQQ